MHASEPLTMSESETSELLTDKVGSFTVAFRSFNLTERNMNWGTSWR